jgi:hypothetical protein
MTGWMETVNARRFKKELGVHPSEFLLRKFLENNRDAINAGQHVWLNIGATEKNGPAYQLLIQRYFVPTPELNGYRLDTTRKRVQRILNGK